MKKISYSRLEHQTDQKWREYTQKFCDNDSVSIETTEAKAFWIAYDKLLAQAQQHQQKQAKAIPQTRAITIAAANNNEFNYSPWVKLMVQHWGEVAFQAQYQEQAPNPVQAGVTGCIDVAKIMMSFFMGIIILTTALFGIYILTVVCLTLFAAIWLIKSKDPMVLTIHYTYGFSNDHIMYEEKTVHPNSQIQPKIRQLQIPYDTIGVTYTEEHAVGIQPKSGAEWVDSNQKRYYRLAIDKRVADLHQMRSFVKDVINTNKVQTP